MNQDRENKTHHVKMPISSKPMSGFNLITDLELMLNTDLS